jgi:hypothetical protein
MYIALIKFAQQSSREYEYFSRHQKLSNCSDVRRLVWVSVRGWKLCTSTWTRKCLTLQLQNGIKRVTIQQPDNFHKLSVIGCAESCSFLAAISAFVACDDAQGCNVDSRAVHIQRLTVLGGWSTFYINFPDSRSLCVVPSKDSFAISRHVELLLS